MLYDDATRKQYDRDVYPSVLHRRDMLKIAAGTDNIAMSSDEEDDSEDEAEKHDAGVMDNWYTRRRPKKYDPVEYNQVKLALSNMVTRIHKKIKEVEDTFRDLIIVSNITILPRAIDRSPHRRYAQTARQAKARLDCVSSLKRIRLVKKLHELLEEESNMLEDYCDYFRVKGKMLRLPADKQQRKLLTGIILE